MKKLEPILTLKPEYKFCYQFITRHALTAITLLVLIVPIAQIGMLFLYSIILICYCIYICFMMIYDKQTYKKSEYQFYEDKLQYQNKTKKRQWQTIAYKEILQVGYRETFFQRMFRKGDLLIVLKDKRLFHIRIYIWSISNPKPTYEQIQNIIGKDLKKKEM